MTHGKIKGNSMLPLVITLVATAIVALVIALYLSHNTEELIEHEDVWVKALLQIGLISMVGAAISMALERFKERLQQRRDLSTLRFKILDELSRAYMEVKLIRRAVQKSPPNTEDPHNLSDDIVAELNQLQAVFELHKRNSIYQFPDSNELKAHLKMMERYLNLVANEPESDERIGFRSNEFNEFAEAYKKTEGLIHRAISGLRGSGT